MSLVKPQSFEYFNLPDGSMDFARMAISLAISQQVEEIASLMVKAAASDDPPPGSASAKNAD